MYGRNTLFEELDAFEGDRFGSLLDIAPDGGGGGEVAQREAEAFDGQPAVVVDIAERLKDAHPLHVAAAGNAAVVLAGVDVLQMFPDRAEAVGMFFSSILAWKVSNRTPTFGWPTSSQSFAASAAVLRK